MRNISASCQDEEEAAEEAFMPRVIAEAPLDVKRSKCAPLLAIPLEEFMIVDVNGRLISVNGNFACGTCSQQEAPAVGLDVHKHIAAQVSEAFRKVASRFSFNTLRADRHGDVDAALRASIRTSVAAVGFEVLEFGLCYKRDTRRALDSRLPRRKYKSSRLEGWVLPTAASDFMKCFLF